MDRTGKKSVSILMDETLWRKAKMTSFSAGVSMAALIDSAIRSEVARLEGTLRAAQEHVVEKKD